MDHEQSLPTCIRLTAFSQKLFKTCPVPQNRISSRERRRSRQNRGLAVQKISDIPHLQKSSVKVQTPPSMSSRTLLYLQKELQISKGNWTTPTKRTPTGTPTRTLMPQPGNQPGLENVYQEREDPKESPHEWTWLWFRRERAD